jgi:choline dehydrogenase-like flavoprotein
MTQVAFETEVLVVGSGAGGATTAAVLAEAGFDVLVLEEGPDVRQGEVVPFSLAQMDRQYRAGGVTAAIGFPSIAYTEGCCVGGSTEINSGLYRRPPEDVIERWRRQHAIAGLSTDELYAICDEVEADLSVQTVPGAQLAASEAMRRGASALGWRHEEIPRWMTYEAGADARDGRRRSMSETYLPRAVAAGARVVADHRVDRLVVDRGRATRALLTTADGRPCTVDAAHVFVCGGAIQTPALLQRSGLRHNVGRSLAVHPTVKLAARFPEEINVAEDVAVEQVKEFAPDLSFGGSASGPALAALALSDAWARAGADREQWRHLTVYYAAITSEGRGTVRAIPGMRDPLVTYRLTRRDRDVMRRGLARLALLMLEAGAVAVHPSYRGAPIVRSRADLATIEATFSALRASVMTVHLCSTAPLGEDRGAAADSFGRIHGTTNIHVNDASLLPDAPGVNPQASVMAFAVRNARHFVETTKRAH